MGGKDPLGLFPPPLWSNGPSPSGIYQHNQTKRHTATNPVQEAPRKHTTQPITTGTSVLGIQCSDGVVIAADTLGSYGRMAKFRDERRIMSVGDSTLVGGSGDLGDLNHIKNMLEQHEIENAEWGDGHKILPRSIHTYMTRVLYQRRSKMNPLWNTLVVGGFSEGKSYL